MIMNVDLLYEVFFKFTKLNKNYQPKIIIALMKTIIALMKTIIALMKTIIALILFKLKRKMFHIASYPKSRLQLVVS